MIRTLRTMLFRRFEVNGTKKWVKEIQALAVTYNSRPHSTTMVPPKQVLADPLALAFRDRQTEEAAHSRSKRLIIPKIGALVVLSRYRSSLQKEASGTFMREPLRVIRVDTNSPIPLVHLEDMKGERIKGGAYLTEIFEIRGRPPAKKIAAVIKQRKRGKKTEYLVSYIDHPKKFNDWIHTLPIYARSLVNIK